MKEEVIRVSDCSILALEMDTEDLYFFDDKGRLHRLKNGLEKYHTIHQIKVLDLDYWSRFVVSGKTITIGGSLRSMNDGKELNSVNYEGVKTVFGSTNIIMPSDHEFRVAPAIGSRQLDLLHIRMRNTISQVFSSNHTTMVLIHNYPKDDRLLHFNLNGTPLTQDDETVNQIGLYGYRIACHT